MPAPPPTSFERMLLTTSSSWLCTSLSPLPPQLLPLPLSPLTVAAAAAGTAVPDPWSTPSPPNICCWQLSCMADSGCLLVVGPLAGGGVNNDLLLDAATPISCLLGGGVTNAAAWKLGVVPLFPCLPPDGTGGQLQFGCWATTWVRSNADVLRKCESHSCVNCQATGRCLHTWPSAGNKALRCRPHSPHYRVPPTFPTLFPSGLNPNPSPLRDSTNQTPVHAHLQSSIGCPRRCPPCRINGGPRSSSDGAIQRRQRLQVRRAGGIMPQGSGLQYCPHGCRLGGRGRGRGRGLMAGPQQPRHLLLNRCPEAAEAGHRRLF